MRRQREGKGWEPALRFPWEEQERQGQRAQTLDHFRALNVGAPLVAWLPAPETREMGNWMPHRGCGWRVWTCLAAQRDIGQPLARTSKLSQENGFKNYLTSTRPSLPSSKAAFLGVTAPVHVNLSIRVWEVALTSDRPFLKADRKRDVFSCIDWPRWVVWPKATNVSG